MTLLSRPYFYAVIPAHAGTYLLMHPEMGPRVRGDDSVFAGPR